MGRAWHIDCGCSEGMKLGLKQSIVSVAVFGLVLMLLVSVDPRVREKAGELVSGNGVSTLSHRATDLGGTLVSAARHQSIENSPLVIFAAVGAILVLFMIKI
jgi:hypothetical protein